LRCGSESDINRGDSDTIDCIAGGIAQAFYKTVPKEIVLNKKTVAG
jgi:ADP-ribosylglycohydrolase